MAVTLTTEEVVALAEETKGNQQKIAELESENRQLRRALWLARVQICVANLEYFKREYEETLCQVYADDCKRWQWAYNKCKAMADKYE